MPKIGSIDSGIPANGSDSPRREASLMTLEQFASLGDLVAAIAVVASFVYLGLQKKQTGRAIGAQTRDSIADGFMAINMPVVSNP